MKKREYKYKNLIKVRLTSGDVHFIEPNAYYPDAYGLVTFINKECECTGPESNRITDDDGMYILPKHIVSAIDVPIFEYLKTN